MSLLYIEEELKKDVIAAQAYQHRLTRTLSSFNYYNETGIDTSKLTKIHQVMNIVVSEIQKQITELKQSEQYKKEYEDTYSFKGAEQNQNDLFHRRENDAHSKTRQNVPLQSPGEHVG
jgi:hypothetical protein